VALLFDNRFLDADQAKGRQKKKFKAKKKPGIIPLTNPRK